MSKDGGQYLHINQTAGSREVMPNNQESPSNVLSIRGYCKETVDLLCVGDALPPNFPERGERVQSLAPRS